MKILLKIKRIICRLIHIHKWRFYSKYVSENKMYGHDHYICDSCKKHKHIKRSWKDDPVVKIINPDVDPNVNIATLNVTAQGNNQASMSMILFSYLTSG